MYVMTHRGKTALKNEATCLSFFILISVFLNVILTIFIARVPCVEKYKSARAKKALNEMMMS